MGISIVLSKVPWKQIFKNGPILVKLAKDLIDLTRRSGSKTKKPVGKKPDDMSSEVRQLATQVDALQTTDTQQAEIIGQLAEQSKDLSSGLSVLAARVMLLLWLVGATIVIAVFALLKGIL